MSLLGGIHFLKGFVLLFTLSVFRFFSFYPDFCWDECVRKVVYTLVLPYLLICVCNLFFSFLEEDCSWSLMNIGQKLLYIIGGVHNLFGVKGGESMWFVYSLIVIKLLWYRCRNNRYKLYGIIILCMSGTLFFNHVIGKGRGGQLVM